MSFCYLFVCLLTPVMIAPTVVPTVVPTPTMQVEETAVTLIDLVNQERRKNGLQPLVENTYLDNSAYAKVQDMNQKGYFSHVSPEGHDWTYFIGNSGYNYAHCGENLSYNRHEHDDYETFTDFMNSSSHRANILEPRWREVGYARVGIYTVLHFGYR